LKRGHQRGGSNSEQQGENEVRFSPLQQVLYPALSRYADVMISTETRQVRASTFFDFFRLSLMFTYVNYIDKPRISHLSL